MDSALRCRTQPEALQTVFGGGTGPLQNLHFKLPASIKATKTDLGTELSASQSAKIPQLASMQIFKKKPGSKDAGQRFYLIGVIDDIRCFVFPAAAPRLSAWVEGLFAKAGN